MNFYDLLYSSINNCDTSNDVIKNNDSDLCLISYEKLEDDYITLQCGHKFNYEPLFNEIYTQKHCMSAYETQKLLLNEIKCPYCRNVQGKILPPKDGFQKCMYVNYPIKYCMMNNNCCHVFKSGIRKGTICNRLCLKTHCTSHIQYANKSSPLKQDNDLIKSNNVLISMKEEVKTITEKLRGVDNCNNGSCKNKKIGEFSNCFRHCTSEDKEKIRELRNNKKILNEKCKELRMKIRNLKDEIKTLKNIKK
jgi:hypothetical protein